MIVGIRVWLRNGHSKGNMLGSKMDETNEQTHGKETKPAARSKGRKDKSCDVVVNMEARLAKVELAMADTRERLDLIEQGIEKGIKDLREYNLHKSIFCIITFSPQPRKFIKVFLKLSFFYKETSK